MQGESDQLVFETHLEGQFVGWFLLPWQTGCLGRLAQYRRQSPSIYGCDLYRPNA